MTEETQTYFCEDDKEMANQKQQPESSSDSFLPTTSKSRLSLDSLANKMKLFHIDRSSSAARKASEQILGCAFPYHPIGSIYVCMCIMHIYIYIYIYIYICVCVCVHIYVYTHAYIHTCIHTHMHMYMHCIHA